jgi:hypothetical protein
MVSQGTSPTAWEPSPGYLAGASARSPRARPGCRAEALDRRPQISCDATNLEAEGQFEHDDPALMSDRFHFQATFKAKNILRLPGSGATSISP